jgi:hypothetical protein
MRRDARAPLADLVTSCELIERFTAESDLESYRSDPLVTSAVERQLDIMREALNRLARAAPDLGSRITDLSAIIGFRMSSLMATTWSTMRPSGRRSARPAVSWSGAGTHVIGG